MLIKYVISIKLTSEIFTIFFYSSLKFRVHFQFGLAIFQVSMSHVASDYFIGQDNKNINYFPLLLLDFQECMSNRKATPC